MNTIQEPQVTKLIHSLYADAAENDPRHRQNLPKQRHEYKDALELYAALKNIYMPVDLQFGDLIYSLARATQAKNLVEFGTSFGISTCFLAAAAKDNGGRVLTTEFVQEKADKAKSNLSSVGLADVVEFRVGDARVSMKTDVPKNIDFVFLDGEKSMYIDFFKLIEPNLKPGCIITADNTDHDGAKTFLAYVRDPKNGYMSSAVMTPGRGGAAAHEITVKIQ